MSEFVEFLEEVAKGNAVEIKEEFQDTLHFIQLWLFWRFDINTQLWKITSGSTEKFMKRREVWRSIYKYVGLPETVSNYVGNYKREEKVVAQLKKFGVKDGVARDAFAEIVRKGWIL